MSTTSSTRNQEWLEKGLGKKMLLKLGWKEGEGLGLEGAGRTGNVVVEKNKEQTGLGFKSTNIDADAGAVKQIEVFDQVLKRLNQEYSTTAPSPSSSSKRMKADESDEEDNTPPRRPRPLRSRRGHKKFLDAKDASLYSKTDMKAILGGLNI